MRIFSFNRVLIILVVWLCTIITSWAQAQPSSFTVKGEVDLFSSPSGNQIGRLIAGKQSEFPFTTEVQNDGKGWVNIQLEGWINKTSTTVKEVGASKNIRVIRKKDNILAAPNKLVIAEIYQGSEIEVLKESKGWLKVNLIGWLLTTQTSLITSPKPQIDKVVTPPVIIPPLSEHQQKISISPAVIEKLSSVLEHIDLQQERSESILKILNNIEEKLKPITNLDDQLKQQNEQQVANTQSILEQIKNTQERINNQSVLEQIKQIHEEVNNRSHRGIISDGSVTLLSEKYLTIGIFIISLILVMGIILWWLIYHRMNKLSGYNQFTEINQGLLRNTDALQLLNTITIKGLEETKGAVGITIERNTNELREYLLKQLTEITQGMNSFFAQLSQRNTKDFSEFRENVFNQLVSNKDELVQLLASNNQNLQTIFTNFSDKTVALLINSSKTTNESLQNLSKEIKESFHNLNEKVVSDLGYIQTNLTSNLGSLNQGIGNSFADFNEKIVSSQTEMRQQLVTNNNEINYLLASNNQNLQTTFTNFSDKTVALLMNSSKTTNESLQNLSKEIKESFSKLNEKVVSDLGSIQTNLTSNLGSLNQGMNISFTDFNEKIISSQTEMRQDISHSISTLNEKVVSDLGSIQTNLASQLGLLNQSTGRSFTEFSEKIIATLTGMRQVMTDAISILNEKILNELGDMRTHLVSSTAESVQSQSKVMEEFRGKVGSAVETSLKNSMDMLNNMFTELRNTTQNHLQLMNQKVEERLNKGFEKNNEVFTNVLQRLQQIDQAQQKISELSTNVVTLQQTLDNKGARGAFGEVQLVDIVRDAFPEKYVKFQQTMKNGKRPDCLLLLPPPTGNIAIDAKFPLENYLIMVNKDFTDLERTNASKNFKRDMKKHIMDISEKYIIPGETADGALMFIPSEAVFAEIHAYHSDIVSEAQNRHVWITSPTTLMAVLTTARAVLADAERNQQAQIIHQHLISLSVEFTRFTKRMDDLSKHIGQANNDVEQIAITAKKITNKFSKIEKVEFEDSIPALASDEEI